MGKRAVKKSVSEYKCERLNQIVKVGDTVMLRPPAEDTPPYVARVEAIDVERADTKVRLRWFYRPEESLGGRRNFHGSKELFLSDHFDVCSMDAVEGVCRVHSFKSYVKLGAVEAEDYFYRFEYKAATGTFKPDHVAVYCVCEMPYNPDDLMVQCDSCKDWFHPTCIHLTPEQVKKMTQFVCDKCLAEGQILGGKPQPVPATESSTLTGERNSKRSKR
ncbi:hypothetical protein CLOM_g3337 [Closterium sp. NIES-68]|nr:hypothetical protein CLOM_g3337 [Closterium sp. NIES-68]GJP83832.1 hypothetical protein CLOP_g13935 [Closterium sp. NIES-67]